MLDMYSRFIKEAEKELLACNNYLNLLKSLKKCEVYAPVVKESSL